MRAGRLEGAWTPWVPALAAAGAALALFALHAPLRSSLGWDDTFYALQTSSLVEDGDLDLRDDMLASGFTIPDRLELLTDTTPAGGLDNEFSVGPALLWLPAYAAGLPLRREEPGRIAVRWSRAQRVALHLLTFLSLAGVLCFLLRLHARAAPGGEPGFLAVAALLLGTPLLVYATSDYTMSHLPSAVATALLIAAALGLERRPRPARALLAGLALGLVFLMRWQDVVFAAVLAAPLLGIWDQRDRGDRGDRWQAAVLAAWAGAGFLAMASLQLHAWRLERGSWLVVPQRQGFFHPWSPEILRFLFSGRSGLLAWSPVFALAALGLVLPWRCRLPRRWALAALAVLLVEVYVNAAAGDWWGGHSFGARRMVSCVPLLPLGLANLGAFRRLSRWTAGLLVLGCGWGLFAGLLYWNGVQDLSLVVRGAPAEGGNPALRAAGAVNDAGEARARARRPSLLAPADYLAADGAGASPRGVRGVLVTALFLGAAAAAAAIALARTPPRRLVTALLVAYLAAALAAHLRLALGPHPVAAERAGWRELARLWHLPPRRYDPADLPPVPAGPRGGPYRYLRAFLEWRAGDPLRARDLMGSLAARGYPAAAEAEAERTRLETGGEVRGDLVRWIPGDAFHPDRWRPALVVPLPPTSPGAQEWDVAVELTPGEIAPGELCDVVELTGDGGAPLAGVAIRGEGGLRLSMPGGAAERPIQLASGRRYSLRLRYSIAPAGTEATLADAGAPAVRLAVNAVNPAAGLGAPVEVTLGSPRSRRRWSALLRDAAFADLRVVAGGGRR